MVTEGQRAAVYVKNAPLSVRRIRASSEQLLELCYRYCMERGYQLCEQYICQAGEKLICSSAPELVHLRLGAVFGEFDVLIVPSLESIGHFTPWNAEPSFVTVDGFYKYRVRVESAIARHGIHDIRQQMFLEVVNFVSRKMQNPRPKGNQGSKRPEEKP